MKKFTAKEKHELILRGLYKDPLFTDDESRERSELIRENPELEKLCVELFGGVMMLASNTKRSMDRADEILALFENGGMSDFANLPPIDGRTLVSIIVKVTDDTKNAARSIQAKENAAKRHAKTNEVRIFVQKAWAAQKDGYKGNKSDFARHYVGIVSNTFIGTTITERQIREVWLKDNPPASKPAGNLAGR